MKDSNCFTRSCRRTLPHIWTLNLILLAGWAAQNLPAVTIQSQITPVASGPQGTYRFTYYISGVDFRDNASVVDELDIRFDPNQFGHLSNGVAGPGFDLLLFQPNDPPGAFGDYSALAVMNHASLTGPFSVDAILNNVTGTPDPRTLQQVFFINSFNNNPNSPNFGDFVSSVSGTTTPIAPASTPEPSTIFLCFATVLCGCGWRGIRKRRPLGAPQQT